MRALNLKQREALIMLRDMQARYPDENYQGAGCADRTWPGLGAIWPAFINWRTAEALERRGLVTIYKSHDGWDIALTEAGMVA